MGYQPATWADIVRCEKYFKGRLTVAADHFNRDPKKGFQFLQEINLLPTPLTATDVAKVSVVGVDVVCVWVLCGCGWWCMWVGVDALLCAHAAVMMMMVVVLTPHHTRTTHTTTHAHHHTHTSF